VRGGLRSAGLGRADFGLFCWSFFFFGGSFSVGRLVDFF